MKLLLLFVLGLTSLIHAEDSQAFKDYSIKYSKFAANVYKESIKSVSGNFMICPLSANIILALLHDGAGNATAKQLATGLNLPEDKEEIRQVFKELSQHLKGNANYTLASANKIYLKEQLAIHPTFKSTAVDIFNAEIENINFLNRDEAADKINKWIEEQTHHKITNVVAPTSLTKDTEALLINTMYFKGMWVQEFNTNYTGKMDFYVNKTVEVEIETMFIESEFQYYECTELNAKFLEMPYSGGDITMTFVLPNDIEGLPELEKDIDKVLTTPKYDIHTVYARIPKFQIESKIDFSETLKSLGVEDAFTDIADFSGICETPVKISQVLQKTFIDVEEQGTTAAAVTTVDVIDIRASEDDSDNLPKMFIANHPFIYYIKSSTAGVMFVGRFVEEAK